MSPGSAPWIQNGPLGGLSLGRLSRKTASWTGLGLDLADRSALDAHAQRAPSAQPDRLASAIELPGVLTVCGRHLMIFRLLITSQLFYLGPLVVSQNALSAMTFSGLTMDVGTELLTAMCTVLS